MFYPIFFLHQNDNLKKKYRENARNDFSILACLTSMELFNQDRGGFLYGLVTITCRSILEQEHISILFWKATEICK